MRLLRSSRPHVLLLIVLALVMAACSGTDDVTAVDATEGESTDEATDDDVTDEQVTDDDLTEASTGTDSLVIAIGSDQGTLTPYTYVNGYPGWNLMNLVYDTLLVLDEDSAPQPHLAESVEVSDDGLTWTLTLAEGVTWHDGEPVTAEDVLFTFEYVQEFTTSRFTGPAGAATDLVADGNTITITLAEPNPEFAIRPLADMPIMPAHVWADVEAPDAAGLDLAVGSGPYVLDAYTPDQSYALSANADYALGTPQVSDVTLSIIPEQQTAIAALQSGEVQAITDGIPPQLVDQLEAQDDIDVVSGPEYGSTLLLMNNERPPFDVPEVRQAISRAIDVEDLVDTVLLGRGTPGDPGFVHPDSPYARASRTHTTDLDEAADLLDAAGAEEGPDGIRELDGAALSFDLLVYADNPDRLRAAELIRDGLAEVGIEVVVDVLDADSVDALVWPDFDVANGRDYDMAMWGWSAPVMLSPGRLVGLVDSDVTVGTLNVTGTVDEQIDALAAAVLAEPVEEGAADAAAELADAIAEQTPFVTLYDDDGVYAYDPATYDGWVFQNGQALGAGRALHRPGSLPVVMFWRRITTPWEESTRWAARWRWGRASIPDRPRRPTADPRWRWATSECPRWP